MSVFANYARYYDLLYRDKNYAGETDYIQSLILRDLPGAKTLLDLGCGTGRHDILLAQKGYAVTGIDMSLEMLAIAKSQCSSVNFIPGDIRTVRLDSAFDVITSLFHVMSYQTSNRDLTAAFSTVRAHLKPGGIFIFDCWYGAAVLTDRPTVRVKRLEDDKIAVTRIAEPFMHPQENLVDVNYHVFVRDKASGTVDELHESHLMRYFFEPEIEQLLEKENLSIVEKSEWMTGKRAGFDTWGVCFVVRG